MVTGRHEWHVGDLLSLMALYPEFGLFMKYGYDPSGGMVHFLGALRVERKFNAFSGHSCWVVPLIRSRFFDALPSQLWVFIDCPARR